MTFPTLQVIIIGMKKKQVEKKKVQLPVKKKKIPEGLEQKIKTAGGKLIKLIEIISPKEVWETNGRVVRTIITHDGVKKIADKAGISQDVQYTILTQPDVYNNYQYTIQARICRGRECTSELGEANRGNLGSKGRNNPANMAQKRAYDRAVFRLLGITGILSEEELSDEEEYKKEDMDGLTHEERRAIAPLCNQLLLAKHKNDLIVFSNKMKKDASKYAENQLVYVRKLYQKRLGELKKVSF